MCIYEFIIPKINESGKGQKLHLPNKCIITRIKALAIHDESEKIYLFYV